MDTDEKTARRETEGRRLLAEYLDAEKTRTQEWLAERISVKQPSVCGWLNGTSRPGSELREAIEIVTGIPAESWKTAREREVVANAKLARSNDDAITEATKAAS